MFMTVFLYKVNEVVSPKMKKNILDISKSKYAHDRYILPVFLLSFYFVSPEAAKKGDLLFSMQRNVADTLARAVFHSSFR